MSGKLTHTVKSSSTSLDNDINTNTHAHISIYVDRYSSIRVYVCVHMFKHTYTSTYAFRIYVCIELCSAELMLLFVYLFADMFLYIRSRVDGYIAEVHSIRWSRFLCWLGFPESCWVDQQEQKQSQNQDQKKMRRQR